MANCECAFCKNDLPFELPDALVQRFAEGKVVVFAGAGISTENPQHCKFTFYDEMRALLKAPGDISFPALMDLVSARPDGRIDLVSRIKSRFSYFTSFADFYRPMTRFHRSLRPLFMVRDVITTNWDDYFEREAGFEPFVYDEDMAFVDSSSRRVVKIHGSITNVGSLVATTDDYERSYGRLNDGPMGAYVKTLVATKTVIYTGYSLRDQNYLSLLKNISGMMGKMGRQAYFLSPQIDHDHLKGLPVSLTPIETDGSFFFEQLREHLRQNSELGVRITGDEAMSTCDDMLSAVREEHDRTASIFLQTRHPLLFLALGYQDGLIHALERIQYQRRTPEYYNHEHVHRLVHGYESKIAKYLEDGNYWDAVYCRGYQNGMLFLMMTDDDPTASWPPPVEVLFDEDVDTVAKAKRYARRRIPADVAKNIADLMRTVKGDDLVPDHTAYA